jgi:type III secretory pathway component EscT
VLTQYLFDITAPDQFLPMPTSSQLDKTPWIAGFFFNQQCESLCCPLSAPSVMCVAMCDPYVMLLQTGTMSGNISCRYYASTQVCHRTVVPMRLKM